MGEVGSSNKLEEGDIEEMLNTGNGVPIMRSFSYGEIAEIVLSTDHYEDSSNNDNDDMSTALKSLYRVYGENVWLINC